MKSENQKDWAILFYLNGNNELAPEMLQSRFAIEKEGSDSYVNILVQHGGVRNRIAEIIRPLHQFLSKENYSGVRRYYITKSTSTPVEDLGNVNMADPKCLYNFIEWGMTNFTAKRIMLVLGGHVFQYVGLMPDYSQQLPYLMGYPEMVNALSLIYERLGKKIDLLVLDTCYVNRIEMLYELGKGEDPPVKNVLTYISGGPISGLPYHILIKTIKDYGDETLNYLIQHIMDNLDYDLIAYEINHSKLEAIKKLYNDIACLRLNENSASCASPSDLLINLDENLPWHNLLKDLRKKMPSLTLNYKNASNKPFGHFYVSAQMISDPRKINLYHRLAFAKNNAWSHLLYGDNPGVNPSDEAEAGVEPIVLKPNDLYALIVAMNSYLTVEQNKQILVDLIKYKGWSW